MHTQRAVQQCLEFFAVDIILCSLQHIPQAFQNTQKIHRLLFPLGLFMHTSYQSCPRDDGKLLAHPTLVRKRAKLTFSFLNFSSF